MKKLLLTILLSVTTQAATVNLNLVSSNQFKLGTNGIYNAALTAITTATNQLNLNTTNLVNVLNFGADPTGVADSQVAISNAWTSIGHNSGKVLYFPPGGTFKTSRLLLPAKGGYGIWGSGSTIKNFATNESWIFGTTGTNIYIKDITFDADFKSPQCLFQNDNSAYWVLDNVKYFNGYADPNNDPAGTAIVIGHYIRKGCNNILWNSCLVSNMTYSTVSNVSRFARGVYGFNLSTNDAPIWNLQFVNGRITTILGAEADSFSIDTLNGTIRKSGVVIANSVFDNYERRALKVMSEDWMIVGNYFYNEVTNSANYGSISLYGARNVIANNVFLTQGFRVIEVGSGLAGQTNNVVIGNVIQSTVDNTFTTRGIVVDGADDTIISDNIVIGMNRGVSVIQDAFRTTVSGNHVVGSGDSAFLSTTNGITTLTPTDLWFENNYINDGTNGFTLSHGTNINVRWNKGTATTFMNRTAGVTGHSLMNGNTLPAITSATKDFGSIAAGASEDQTITVTGAAVGDNVSLGLPAAPAAGIVFNTFVSATDTVTIRASNITAVPVDPASASYTVQVFKQ